MKSSNSQIKLSNKLMSAILDFAKLSIIFIFIFVISRFHEITTYGLEHSFKNSDIWLQFIGLFFDIVIALQLLFPLAIVFFILYIINRNFAIIIYYIISSIIVITNLLLIAYFKLSLIPLGNDLFGYSMTEIIHTVNAAGRSNITPYLLIILILGLFLFLSIMIIKINISKITAYIMLCLILLTIIFNSFLNAQSFSFENDFNYYLSVNKTEYFISNIYNHSKNKTSLSISNIDKIKYNDNNFEYLSKEYPLLHRENTPDVLSSFFNKVNNPPNLVFIIVESLGRAYSGQNAYLGSFTPFLDSLMQRSLYWENFLSTGGRTFAVLPSIFGSLPFGEKGFLEMGNNMPAHQSLLTILKKNAYTTKFYYGGDAHFDLMDVFLKKQNIDMIYDNSNFGKEYEKLPVNKEGFAWGFGDKEIFRKALNVLKKENKQPRVDIFLTLAMHSPFLIPHQDYYNKKFEKRLKDLKLNDTEIADRRRYHQNYECILYFDDALKYFINEYSKRVDYKNTIFIITGDHRMPEIPISTQLDRFHVPLVIFSPMLKKYQKFSSISTQFDITPTILSYLNKSYGIKIPAYTAWMGHGIDISIDYNKKRSYPLMRNKNELVDYIDGSYFLSNNELYLIQDNLSIDKIKNPKKLELIKSKLQNFMIINNYVCKNNKIIPDSLK